MVHLKRFSYSRYLKKKLETFVDFPIHDLDLAKYSRQIYELYAISNHYGSMGGGHYTAYAKVNTVLLSSFASVSVFCEVPSLMCFL